MNRIAPSSLNDGNGLSPRSSDVSGGGPASRSATPASFNDDLLMDPEQMRRFIHSHDFNEREVGKDPDNYGWRDAFWFFTGFWPGTVFGIVGLGIVILALVVDWG